MNTPELIIAIVFLIVASSCKTNIEQTMATDNIELKEMVIKDQKIRQSPNLEELESQDILHRKRVLDLLAEGKIITGTDKYNAAIILQHTNLIYCDDKLMSISSENYYLAYALSRSAMESGLAEARIMTATSLDRYLLYTLGFQKFGTQKVYDKGSGEMVWAPIDSTTTDEERNKLGVKPLAELLKECSALK